MPSEGNPDPMYAVVGCSDCSMLWVIEGRPETSQCPRCGTTRQYAKRRKFVTTDDEDHAREVRASMLANRQGEGETFAEMDSFAEMEEYVEESGIDDEEFLERSGVDPGSVAAAGDAATESGGSKSRQEIVRDALGTLEDPTEDDVVRYATARGVSAEYARTALSKLARAGDVTENRGTYRLL